MEMQACANQYVIAEADSRTANYFQGSVNSKTGQFVNVEPKKMRVLFSGSGKAESNMGMAPIPALRPFNLRIPYN